MYSKKVFRLISKNSFIKLIVSYLLITFVCYSVSLALSRTIWQERSGLIHTAIELLCVFVALYSFIIVWFTDKLSNFYTKIIGYGFLAVAIFDIFHTYYFQDLNLYPSGYFDINTRYWVLGRLTEAIVIFLGTSNIVKVKPTKWISLFIAITIPVVVCLVVLYFPKTMPVLLTSQRMTISKKLMEYVIIALLLVNLYFIQKKISRSGMISYKNISMAVMFTISAELCFTLYDVITSFYMIFGHIFKLVAYFYLLRGIFVSAIIFPYEAVVKSKQKLNDTKSELRDILNGLPISVITYENDKSVSFANTKALELFKCKSKDFMSLTPKQLFEKFSPIDNNFIDELMKNSNNSLNTVQEYATPEGGSIKLSVNATKYKHGILVSLNDVRKEQELNNLRIQTHTILNSITNNVLMTDKNMKVIMLNKAFTDIIEMDNDEIIGMKLDELYHKMQFTKESKQNNVNLLKPEYGNAVEASFITPAGNKKYVIYNFGSILNYENTIIGYIFVSSDITGLKKEQQKLLQQEKLALLGQMGSGIVHETKNHLASIKGYCQLLSMKVKDDQLKLYIDRIEDITADVNKVIVDFLSMAKPTETLMDITSLNEIIESMSYMIESPSFMKGVNIDISLSECDADINVDESLIKQVILNITKNAIEAMSDVANPLLIISTKLSVSTNEAILIISDNGKGIPSEALKKLGTPFFTTKENGTGLGLSMCYKIIREHGGSIDVSSELGIGTIFTISLPLYKNET